MALAETAELVADLRLKNNLSPTANQAKKDLAGLDAATEGTTQKVGILGSVAARTSGSMEHFRGRVGNLTKGIGILGLGGAVVGLTAFLKDSYKAATQFGDTVIRISTLTGVGEGRVSQFVDAFDKLGVNAEKSERILGFLTKTVGNLTQTRKDAKKVEDEYGFSLINSNGRVKDSLTIVRDFTSYFENKQIPAQQKAALGAKLFGRSWTDMIPIFEKGRKGYDEAIASAMKLSKEDVANLKKSRDATRNFNDALGDLQVMVGLRLMPTLTELAQTAANWIDDPTNQKTLLGFLDQGIELGKGLAKFLTGSVLPAVKGLASTAEGFWNSLPGPLQDLLVTGLVADRTVKYLFGFSLAGVGGDVIGGLFKQGLGGILGKLGFTRGSTPANPLYVAVAGGLGNLGGGGGAQAGGGSVGAAGGLASKLGRAVSILGAVTIAGTSIAALAEQFGIFQQTVQQSQADLQAKADAAAHQDSQAALANLKNLNSKLGSISGLDRILGDTFGGKQEADALENLSHAVASGGKLTASQITDAISTLQEAQRQALARGNNKVADSIGTDIAKLQSATKKGASQQATAVQALGRQLAPPLKGANAKLGQIAAQPTTVQVTTNVSTAISVRDTETASRTASRYGFVAQ